MTDHTYDIADTLSVAEAAKLLGCSGQTVRERIKRGELQGYDVRTSRGKEWRVIHAGPLAQAAEGHSTLSGITGIPDRAPPQLHTYANEPPNQEVDQIRKLPASLPQVQPGVIEALALLREEMQRTALLATQNSGLAAENARLREQLATRPALLAAPALGFWLALWATVRRAKPDLTRLSAGLGAGRAG